MEDRRSVRIRVRWDKESNYSPEYVNQFLIQQGSPIFSTGGDEDVAEASVYMLFGHTPPLLVLDEEDVKDLDDPHLVNVQARAALLMSKDRAAEYWRFLGQALGMLPGVPGSPLRGQWVDDE